MALPSSLLCPIDFSAHSERALRHALALSGVFGAHLTVVTVNDPVLAAGAAASGHGASLREQTEAALVETLSRAPQVAAPFLPALDIATGEAAPEILAAADRAGAQLIVMGARGLGGASRLVFGSTTERVVRASTVPVLAVPDYAPERLHVDGGEVRISVSEIVAAIGLDAADGAVAGAAAAWAGALGATLVLGHVSPDAPAPAWWPFTADQPAETPASATSALGDLAAKTPGAAHAAIEVRRGSVAADMAAIVRDRNAGMLVVSRGGGHHRLGATAYRVMTEADVPTLIVAAG